MTIAERPAWVDDELFPFESRFLDIGGHRVHYVDEGSGPTLLLLHGNPTWSFDYSTVISSLRADFRCVAIDYRIRALDGGIGIPVSAHRTRRNNRQVCRDAWIEQRHPGGP